MSRSVTESYKPVGMIKQLPALRSEYRRKNPAGGRMIPVSYIGAAVEWEGDPAWMAGLKGSHPEVVLSIGGGSG